MRPIALFFFTFKLDYLDLFFSIKLDYLDLFYLSSIKTNKTFFVQKPGPNDALVYMTNKTFFVVFGTGPNYYYYCPNNPL